MDLKNVTQGEISIINFEWDVISVILNDNLLKVRYKAVSRMRTLKNIDNFEHYLLRDPYTRYNNFAKLIME